MKNILKNNQNYISKQYFIRCNLKPILTRLEDHI